MGTTYTQPDIGRKRKPHTKGTPDTVGFLTEMKRRQEAGVKLQLFKACRQYNVGNMPYSVLPDLRGRDITDKVVDEYRQSTASYLHRMSAKRDREPKQGTLPLNVVPVLTPSPREVADVGDTIENLVARLKTLGAKTVALTF